MLAYPVYHGSADLHEQQYLAIRIADHKHRAPAIRSSRAYTSSIHVVDLQWQAVPDDFPGNRNETIKTVE